MTLKTKKINKNKNRSKLFGVVINPKLDKTINWENLSIEELDKKLKEIKFLDKFLLTKYLNDLKIENISKNLTSINNFVGQLELGKNSKIPHYQLAIEIKTICTKKKVLEALEEKINGHISVEIQFNFEEMKKYCTKDSDFISVEYSGKIYKHEWEIDFLDRKPILRKVLQNPFKWQEFLESNILKSTPDDRTVDWIIDPVGNTGKSSFARAYVSKHTNDGIFMKIDNLDRMELSLIKKIETYRSKYFKDPKVLIFDFPRASDHMKVLKATALMEDAKSGYLETTFGGNHKEIQIGDIHVIVFSNNCPDLSVLSVDRWRLWTLTGSKFDNIIWPVNVKPCIKKINTKNWNIIWTISLKYLNLEEIEINKKFSDFNLPKCWLDKLGDKNIYTTDLTTNINYSPNFIRTKAMNLLTNESIKNAIINFKEY